jgi:hypothetical protein
MARAIQEVACLGLWYFHGKTAKLVSMIGLELVFIADLSINGGD